VPSLVNLTEDAAVAAIKARNLVYGTSTPAHSPTVPAGTVIDSEPASGSAAREGDTVNLTVSDGLIDIPSVVGQDVATANTTLSGLQLQINAVQDPSCGGGKVTSQSLTGPNQPQRSDITIRYCSGG
jgi:serine/threonine-protein kinase